MAKIKVLLVEDNRLLREGTTSLLNAQKDIKAVSSGGNSKALERARQLGPDVLLLDLGAKSQSTVRVLEALKRQHPKAEVVVMDLIPSHADVIELIQDDVSGYVPKNASLDDFLQTIRSVAKGVKVPLPAMADSLFSRIVESAIQQGSVKEVVNSVKLSRREQEVLGLLSEGKSIIQVSHELKLEFFTVKSHIRNILDKLALHTRLELTAFARSGGLAKKTSRRKGANRV